MLVVEKFLAGLGHADPELNRGFSFEGHNLAFFLDELHVYMQLSLPIV
jgi:hypothetical protein